jgi:lipoprotein-anchoring transpeptidase ErfK/SrfK
MIKKGSGAMQIRRIWFFIIVAWLIPVAAFSLPKRISPPGEKLVVVDPVEHAWGAYTASGYLVRSGLASAGADWCADMGQECRTDVGVYRVRSIGGAGCKSPSFPLPKGGAPMPYCMYFTPYQALHGSNHVVSGNISHGCVRMHVGDARWLSHNFVQIGTLVVIRSY